MCRNLGDGFMVDEWVCVYMDRCWICCMGAGRLMGGQIHGWLNWVHEGLEIL